MIFLKRLTDQIHTLTDIHCELVIDTYVRLFSFDVSMSPINIQIRKWEQMGTFISILRPIIIFVWGEKMNGVYNPIVLSFDSKWLDVENWDQPIVKLALFVQNVTRVFAMAGDHH